MQSISVTQFNNFVKDIFNNEELLHSVNVVGEVFGVSRAKTAIYFSVKDEQSSLPCVCFSPLVFGEIKEGDLVTLYGGPNFYTKSGRFNYVAYKIEPAGQGLLYQRFIELKNRLEQEGLFDPSHKKPMPKSIKRIGVVTSKEGAVIQDIKNITWRRNPSIDIVLYPTKVQGNDADKEICEGINFFSNYDNVDVVIVARGGGSLEDLSAYNTESVARATYNCNKPIVSAVGHETDFTIIDFVSDLRAPTPSAAAELLTQDRQKEKETLNLYVKKIERDLINFISDKTELFQDTISNITTKFEDFLVDKKYDLTSKTEKLSKYIEHYQKDETHSLELKISVLSKLDPKAILRRGFAKIEQNGKNVDSVKKVDMQNTLQINFADGYVVAMPKEENFKGDK